MYKRQVERYAPLVKRIAHHLLLRMPASVQIDDLVQSGMIGLLEAAKKYDISWDETNTRWTATDQETPTGNFRWNPDTSAWVAL